MIAHGTTLEEKSRTPAERTNVVRSPLTILLLTALLGSACASTAPAKLSKDAVILDLRGAPQQSETYACGLVSVESLCGYWRVPLDEAAQADIAQTAEREHGLSGAEMCTALGSLGFETFLFEGRLDHGTTGLFHQIDAARPALVMLGTNPKHGHYVLCIGYDEPERQVCLLDPVRGRVLLPYEDFEKSWSAREHFTLIAIPRSPATLTERSTEAP
jgi:Peptidase C39 family